MVHASTAVRQRAQTPRPKKQEKHRYSWKSMGLCAITFFAGLVFYGTDFSVMFVFMCT